MLHNSTLWKCFISTINHTVLFAALPARSACCYRSQNFSFRIETMPDEVPSFHSSYARIWCFIKHDVKYSQSEAIWRLSQCLHYVASAILSKTVGKIYVIKYFGNLNFRFGVSQNVRNCARYWRFFFWNPLRFFWKDGECACKSW